MNGNSIFLDTNIVLYLISGDRTLANLLDNKTIYISFISELELELISRELMRQNMDETVELAEKYGLSSMTMEEINEEVKAVRRAKNNR